MRSKWLANSKSPNGMHSRASAKRNFRIKTLCFFLLALSCVARASEKAPLVEPLSRYQAMIERSPFALATEGAPVPAATDNAGFTKDLVLTGAVRLSNGEYITIASKDQTQRFGLMTGETYNGITIASVTWSDAVGKTKVTLKRGTEYGTISFDEAAARGGAAGATPAEGTPPVPGNGQAALPPGMISPNASQSPAPNFGNPAIRRPRIIRSIPAQP